MIKKEAQKRNIQKTFNITIKRRIFNVGEQVLRKALGNKIDHRACKMMPTWEGPYKIIELTSREVYRLENLDEKEDLRRNVDHLRNFFI